MHREENVDGPQRLNVLLRALSALADRTRNRMIVTTHPRLRRQLEARAEPVHGSIEFLEPFGYFDYNKLQRNGVCVLSDSGTISEESSLCGFPAVSIRDSIERPEALDTGSMVLTGIDVDSIQRSVGLVVEQWAAGVRPSVPLDYQVLDCSVRVSRLIHGLAAVHDTWLGHRPRREVPVWLGLVVRRSGVGARTARGSRQAPTFVENRRMRRSRACSPPLYRQPEHLLSAS